jgi:hypothetical protein
LAASAAAVCVKALNKVDLPTFGNPTMPHLKPIALQILMKIAGARWRSRIPAPRCTAVKEWTV